MSLPVFNDLLGMDVVYYGQPFVQGPAKSNIDLFLMDTVYYGQPFVVNAASSSSSTSSLTEYIFILDSATGNDGIVGPEGVGVLDTLTRSTSVYLTEYLSILDSATSASGNSDGVDGEFTASCLLQIMAEGRFDPTTTVQIAVDEDRKYSQDVVVQPSNLVAVTNATSPSNPTTPTYISNGQVIYSFPQTLPASSVWSNARCYVKFNCNDLIGTVSASATLSYGLDIQDGGGTWSASTVNEVGDFFDQIQLFGLTGTITRTGFDYPRSPYTTKGILGSPKMNKELLFLTYGTKFYIDNFTNQNLAKPDITKYKTHQDAARLIASLTGSTLTWRVQDYPLANFTPQASQTGLQALSSLAQEVGAVLRWNGGTHYTVAYPDTSFGLWEVPDCCLITSFSKECNADLNTGYYTPGVYMVPQLSTFNAGTHVNNLNEGTVTAANGTVGAKQIEEIYRTTTPKIIGSSPVETVDLPYDFEDVYIQIVTSTDGQGRFVTFDPHRWTLLQTGFAGQYINNVDVAGVLKPVVLIDPSLFPQNNTDLQNGPEYWYMKIGITRKQVAGGTAGDEDDAEKKLLLGQTVMRYKFVPTCTGTISATFFGSIPLPGMTARATMNGRTIQGIIESVNFSSPGIITVNVVDWTRLVFYQRLSEL